MGARTNVKMVRSLNAVRKQPLLLLRRLRKPKLYVRCLIDHSMFSCSLSIWRSGIDLNCRYDQYQQYYIPLRPIIDNANVVTSSSHWVIAASSAMYDWTSGSMAADSAPAGIATTTITKCSSTSGACLHPSFSFWPSLTGEAGMGADVGVPLGLALLTGLVLFWRKWRQVQRLSGQYTRRTDGKKFLDTYNRERGTHELEENRNTEPDGVILREMRGTDYWLFFLLSDKTRILP